MGWWSGVPEISDPRLRDFNFLLQPIECLYRSTGWARNLDEVAVTVANRLASMTYRMERTPWDSTACAARWYLESLKDIDITPGAVDIIEPLKMRLWNAIHAHEERVGYECDPGPFGRLVGSTDQERCAVLYGPPFWRSGDDLGGALGPRSPLSSWLSSSCWKWASMGRY